MSLDQPTPEETYEFSISPPPTGELRYTSLNPLGSIALNIVGFEKPQTVEPEILPDQSFYKNSFDTDEGNQLNSIKYIEPPSIFDDKLALENYTEIKIDVMDRSFIDSSADIFGIKPPSQPFSSLVLSNISPKKPTSFRGKTIKRIPSRYKIEDYQTNFEEDLLTIASTQVEKDAETIVESPSPQAQARAYRRNKLRKGALGDLVSTIPKDPKVRNLLSPFKKARDRIMANTHKDGEHHRDLAALFAGLLGSSGELRERTMQAIDQTSCEESDGLKAEAREKGLIKADVVIVGAGIQGAVLSSKIRAEAPDARIIILDEKKRLGGQFRQYGERPVFYTNGRNFRPQNNQIVQLPGSNGNLNSFGENAVLQLTDITSDTYPHNLELGDTAAVNVFMSAETMLGSEVIEVDPNTTTITARDTYTGENYKLKADAVIMAPGLGERQKSFRQNEWTAEKVLSHFADSSNEFPMDEFIGKRIAIKGGGDTGRIIAELFARLAPPEAYGNSIVQLGGPENITWFGTNFSDRDGFCDTNRPRYNRLASFIVSEQFGNDALIRPVASKIAYTQPAFDNKRTEVYTEAGYYEGAFDVIIDAADLPDQFNRTKFLLSDYIGALGSTQGDFLEQNSRFLGVDVAKKITGRSVYITGAGSKSRLSQEERESFADAIFENTASIWANTPRAEVIGARVALLARINRRFSKDRLPSL